jgi:N utilization substance protein A
MKTDFVIALTQLAAERNLPKEVIIKTLEAALVPIFKKTSFAPEQDVSVKIIPSTGEVKVYARKTVVKRTSDPRQEMTLAQARKLKPDIQVGDSLEVEYTPADAGRIAAQTAKQVILQRLREAERDAIFGEYADKEGDIVSGVIHVVESKQIVADIGRAEAILPLAEQVTTEHYRVGQRLKLYLMKVVRTSRGTQLVVSRTHQNLLRRLFELEVPEIFNGTVELKALAREPGYRSKVAVAARQEGVDAVGCCLGLRSIRIQNITKELNGEKIDVIQWHSDPAVFIASALSPASVVKVDIAEEQKTASVIVPDRQLSLAIGKGGQNARLAARLTGWRIDIKSVSMVEGEKVAPAAEPVEEVAEEAREEAAEARLEEAVEERVEAVVEEVAEEVAQAEVVPAAEAVAEAAAEPVAEPAAEAPAIPQEAEPVVKKAKARPKEEPPAEEEAAKVYSVEEILSEIEAATERIQNRYGGAPTPPRAEPKVVRKGKKADVPKDDLTPVKAKAKKAVRRHRVSEDELDLDEGPDVAVELEEDVEVEAEE